MKHDAEESCSPSGGARVLVDELNRIARSGWQPPITLIGHSAGCQVLCHWLTMAPEVLPATLAFDVVWLAPVCTVAEAARVFARCGSRIRGFRQFGLSDAFERRDALVPGVYPRSLLYFVSGVLEAETDTPLMGMERYFRPRTAGRQRDAHIAAVEEACAGRPGGFVWSPDTSAPGGSSAARHHATIDDDAVTVASVQHLLRHGLLVPRPGEKLEQ